MAHKYPSPNQMPIVRQADSTRRRHRRSGLSAKGPPRCTLCCYCFRPPASGQPGACNRLTRDFNAFGGTRTPNLLIRSPVRVVSWTVDLLVPYATGTADDRAVI